MGNIVHCCRILSNFIKCQDALTQGGPERSALLSSEDSECDPVSLSDNSEEDLSTVSTGVTNLTLEPDNFLFPDIILSSSLGGDVALVEPMVCLLVSEEEEGARVDEGGEKNCRGRTRAFSEVETQTEAGTQVGMQAQTQTEILDTGAADEVVVDVHEEQHTLKQADVPLDAQTDPQVGPDSATWLAIDSFVLPGKVEWLNNLASGDKNKAAKRDNLSSAPPLTNHPLQTGQNTEPYTGEEQQRTVPTHGGGRNIEPQRTSVMLMEPKVENIKPRNYTDAESAEDFDDFRCWDGTRQSGQDDEQVGQEAVPSDQCVNRQNRSLTPTKASDLSEDHADQTADESLLAKNLTQHEEGWQQSEATGDTKETTQRQVKEEVLSSVGGLFDGGRGECVKAAPPCQSADEDAVSPYQLTEADKSIHVDLQDTSFTVRIQPPGTEGFELQVSGQLLVVELHRVLMEHELTCHRTCFSLQLGATTLDGLTKLCSVQGIQDRAAIKVVEESYSVRDARLHLRHVRDLLRSLDPADAYNGVNCSSLSYLSFYTRGAMDSDSLGSKQASGKESVDFKPPEYLLPGCKDLPLTPLQPIRNDRKPLQCLRVLTLSSWNPPPGNRKMHGDLMYLNVLTLEDKELNITSSTRGFYLNQSTAFNFNPKPANPKILCHSLIELLSQVSPAFRKSFSALQKRRVQQHPYERIATPFQVFTWIACQGDHTLDCVRTEDMHPSHMGPEEHTAGQIRDWNEELQGCRELARNSLQERLQRERSIFKTNSDFVEAATRGAVAVIDGNVIPLNPGEAPHMQMFIWNNLFFSLGFDIAEHYLPIGGDSAAQAAALCDLRGAQAYTNVDAEGLHTLGTAVVDYRGIRVIAQTIVPGILEKHQEQSVIYGSNDYGKTVYSHPRFLELLDKTSKSLRIQRHQVLDHNNSPVELCSSVETKGIMGNDSRPYVLDLLRTFPPDLNFQFSETEEDGDVPEECRRFGFPQRHCHSLASLRPELIEAFIQHRHELYVKMVSQGFLQLEERDKSKEQSEEPPHEPEDPASDADDKEFQRRNVILNACTAAGSVCQTYFDIRFNPDVCSPGVRFPSGCTAEVQEQKLLLWDAAAFLLSNQIPALLGDCLDHTEVAMDGATLTSALHRQGVNVRYLGAILRELERSENKERLNHIQRICVGEIIIRSAKHLFRTYLQDVEPAAFSAAVSHFLNCLLSSPSCFPDACSGEPPSRRRSRRRRIQASRVAVGSSKDSEWTRLTPGELWGRIRTEAQDYYHYRTESQSVDEVIEKHGLQRISLLREIAIKTGIQVKLREYVFESRHRPAFSEEDVVNMFPVVKHLRPTGTDASGLVRHAEVLIQQGLLKDGYELISQALALFSSVCGVLHEDVCVCLRLLGRLSYIFGDYSDALSYQEKVVMSSERVQGIDHPQTIQDYTHLALYYFAAGRLSTSLRLLYRARYLTLLVAGEDHPQVALLDTMLGLALFGLMEHELSLKFLLNALILSAKYHGPTSLKYAHSHHLLATVYESKGELRLALQHEKEASSIYETQAGEDCDRSKESSEYLEILIQQAAVLQNTIDHTQSHTPDISASALKFSKPSLPAVLHQLSQACGILPIQTSAKETTDLRTEK